MMKNNLGRTQTLFIATFLVNVLLAGSCLFLWHKIGDEADKIDIRVKELAIQETQKSSSHQLATLIKKEVDPVNEQIMKYFIHRDNFIEFIEHIEALADKADVVVDIRSTELVDFIQLSIDFEGSFSDSMYFVGMVESLPINLKINNLRIKQKSDDDLWQGWTTVILPGLSESDN